MISLHLLQIIQTDSFFRFTCNSDNFCLRHFSYQQLKYFEILVVKLCKMKNLKLVLEEPTFSDCLGEMFKFMFFTFYHGHECDKNLTSVNTSIILLYIFTKTPNHQNLK